MHATASMLPEAYSRPISSLVHDFPAVAKDMDRVHESDAHDGSAAKGLMMALTMEATAVLLVSGTWLAWHFMR